MNYAALIKRANKVIDTAAKKSCATQIHFVENGTDIANLSGLVIIANRTTFNSPKTSNQAES